MYKNSFLKYLLMYPAVSKMFVHNQFDRISFEGCLNP